MRGLLTKDIRFILGQKRYLLVMLFVVVIFALQGQQAGIGYMIILTGMLTIMTISYDEYNNGNAFLFTMPISRRGYVLEKYALGIGLGAVSCLVVTVFTIAFGQLRQVQIDIGEYAAVSVSLFLGMQLMLALMLPLMFQLGAERGRIAFSVIIIVFVMMMIGIGSAAMGSAIWTQNLAWLADIGPVQLVGAIALAVGICMCVSTLISVRIMQKKQF